VREERPSGEARLVGCSAAGAAVGGAEVAEGIVATRSLLLLE